MKKTLTATLLLASSLYASSFPLEDFLKDVYSTQKVVCKNNACLIQDARKVTGDKSYIYAKKIRLVFPTAPLFPKTYNFKDLEKAADASCKKHNFTGKEKMKECHNALVSGVLDRLLYTLIVQINGLEMDKFKAVSPGKPQSSIDHLAIRSGVSFAQLLKRVSAKDMDANKLKFDIDASFKGVKAPRTVPVFFGLLSHLPKSSDPKLSPVVKKVNQKIKRLYEMLQNEVENGTIEKGEFHISIKPLNKKDLSVTVKAHAQTPVQKTGTTVSLDVKEAPELIRLAMQSPQMAVASAMDEIILKNIRVTMDISPLKKLALSLSKKNKKFAELFKETIDEAKPLLKDKDLGKKYRYILLQSPHIDLNIENTGKATLMKILSTPKGAELPLKTDLIIK